jgi:hypothetical protein
LRHVGGGYYLLFYFLGIRRRNSNGVEGGGDGGLRGLRGELIPGTEKKTTTRNSP